jgi:hypothetical protein
MTGRHGAALTPDGDRHRDVGGKGGCTGRAGERGFTVAELTVTLIVVAEIIIATLLLFDASGKLGKAEMQVAGMQQALRIGQYEVVRMVRMAGRGPLPVSNNPALAVSADLFAGTALAVRNNVAAGSGIIAGSAPTDPPAMITNPRVLAGTDVLTVRGVFSTPLYQINYSNPALFTNKGDGTGTVTISAQSPTGVSQPFDSKNAPGSFEDAIAKGRTESLILVSPVDDTVYLVAQLDPTNSKIDTSVTPATATIAFNVTSASTAALSASGLNPATFTNAASVGILEEYRYYVRDVRADTTKYDSNGQLNPLLSRARFYAGTDMAWDKLDANLYQDIGDGILDLQVALGFDLNNPLNVQPPPPWDPSLVQYLFDTTADNGTAAPFSPLPIPAPPMLYARVNILARTSRHDVQYRAPLIVSIEDHAYSSTPANGLDPNGSAGLNQRRRLTQTVVALRNGS